MFRMKFLIKSLIYHAYHMFPEQEWQIKDIVVAENCEIATINSYNQFCKLRNKKITQQWRTKFMKNKKVNIDYILFCVLSFVQGWKS